MLTTFSIAVVGLATMPFPSTSMALTTLKQACYLRQTIEKERVAAALATVAGSAVPTGGELGKTLSAHKWRAVFSAAARPSMKSRMVIDPGKWLPPSSYEFAHAPVRAQDGSVADGSFSTTVRLLFGAISIAMSGSYRLGAGARMTLDFERFGVRLLGFLPLASFALGPKGPSWLRALLKRARGGAKQRPNVFYWHYADACIAVASGSSGRAALWGSC